MQYDTDSVIPTVLKVQATLERALPEISAAFDISENKSLQLAVLLGLVLSEIEGVSKKEFLSALRHFM